MDERTLFDSLRCIVKYILVYNEHVYTAALVSNVCPSQVAVTKWDPDCCEFMAAT